MTEQRRSKRKKPAGIVPIFDTVMGQAMGHLGNVSPEGFMLISTEPVAEGSVFQMSFALDDHSGTAHAFNIGATCLWATESNSGNYWAGFQVIDMSDDQTEKLYDLYRLM